MYQIISSVYFQCVPFAKEVLRKGVRGSWEVSLLSRPVKEQIETSVQNTLMFVHTHTNAHTKTTYNGFLRDISNMVKCYGGRFISSE